MRLRYKGHTAYIKEVNREVKAGEVFSGDERLALKFPRLFELTDEEEKVETEPKPLEDINTAGIENQCKVCGRICKSNAGLKTHMRVHKKKAG